MLKLKLFCSFLFFIFCADFSSAAPIDSNQNFDEKFKEYNSYLTRSLDARRRAKEFYQTVEDSILSSEDLRKIHAMTVEYKEIREYFWSLINENSWFGDRYTEFYIVEGPTEISKERKRVRALGGNPKRRYRNVSFTRFAVNPNDEAGLLKILEIKMALNSAFMLYDNYIHAIKPYVANRKLRRTINQDNIQLSNYLEEIAEDFNEDRYFQSVLRGIEKYETLVGWESENTESLLSLNGHNAFLNDLITRSHSFQKIKDISYLRVAWEEMKNLWLEIGDRFFNFQTQALNEVSKGFGNSVGLIQTRHGKLYNLPKTELESIENKLQPLDIIFEKTPFRLTDKFIPGHWGHVAIWVGNQNQLEALGIWAELDDLDEFIRTHNGYRGIHLKELIQSGHSVLEALRPGVQINTLEHFMDVDDLAVTRLREQLTKDQKIEYLRKAFKQIGKDYDFNFDVQTDKKIVCSELAYVVFEDMTWPTDRQAGRYTISPDHVAIKAVEGGEFKPVLIYHDGAAVEENLETNFQRLLDLDYANID